MIEYKAKKKKPVLSHQRHRITSKTSSKYSYDQSKVNFVPDVEKKKRPMSIIMASWAKFYLTNTCTYNENMIQSAERAKEKIHGKNPEKTYMDDSLRVSRLTYGTVQRGRENGLFPLTLLGNERKYVLYRSYF